MDPAQHSDDVERIREIIPTVFGAQWLAPPEGDFGTLDFDGDGDGRAPFFGDALGQDLRIHAPRSRSHRGPYGRLFPHLDPWEPLEEPDKEIAELASHSFDASNPKTANPVIPGGYTVFGQFLVHDLTFDPTTVHQRQVDPERLVNFRTPRLDLDSVYGGGPEDSPQLYDKDREYCFYVEENEHGVLDLPRNGQGVALVPDPRNDATVLIAQLHLAFLLYHNRRMDLLADAGIVGARAFVRAQRETRWAYQWLVVHDWLGHLCGTFGRETPPDTVNPAELLERCCSEVRQDRRSGPLGLFTWRDAPYVPIEFAVAIGRVGHAMITDEYDLNGAPVPLTDLVGRRPVPKKLEVDWRRFFPRSWDDLGAHIQPSGRLGVRMADALRLIRDDRGPLNLVERDLVRAYQLGIPAGQDVDRALGIRGKAVTTSEPFWYHLLRESRTTGIYKGSTRGQALSEVGARLMCDVLIGFLIGDPGSFLRHEPGWRPGSTPGYWGMAHFLEQAAQA